MRPYILIILAIFVFTSCKQEPKKMGWKYAKTMQLDGINPIGIASAQDGLWVSDGDHFRVVKVDEKGTIIQVIDSLDRPMHIAQNKGQLVIPQYGNDQVIRFRQNQKIVISLKDSLDAPAGADIHDNEIVIADFYNNRIHYAGPDNEWIVFGTEGKANGEFYYPTDVQLTDDAIWVADAYNNRLQKFTKNGEHLLTVGEDQKMNAATGIYVSDSQVFATDFENNRVIVFALDGSFVQELKEEIEKPTDIIVKEGILFVANYKSSSLSVYEWSELDPIGEHTEEDHHHHDDEERGEKRN